MLVHLSEDYGERGPLTLQVSPFNISSNVAPSGMESSAFAGAFIILRASGLLLFIISLTALRKDRCAERHGKKGGRWKERISFAFANTDCCCCLVLAADVVELISDEVDVEYEVAW